MAIPVEKRVVIAVWFLATPGEYHTIGHLFGVARCTVCVIVREVCKSYRPCPKAKIHIIS